MVVGYLALPFDLVPDVIPVAWPFAVRHPSCCASSGPDPARSLDVVERLAGRRRVPG